MKTILVLFLFIALASAAPTNTVIRQLDAIPQGEATNGNETTPSGGETADANATDPVTTPTNTTTTNDTVTAPVAEPSNDTTASNATAPANETTPQAPVSVTPVTAGQEGTAWGILSQGVGAEDDDLEDYDVFARAVSETNYAGVLTRIAGWSGLTILAPNDAAFQKTLTELGYSGSSTKLFETLGRVLANQSSSTVLTTLYEIVGYHVIIGANSPEMLRRKPLMSYAGKMITVEQNGTIRDLASATNIAPPQIVGDPIPVDNGMIYQVDRVLFPFVVDVDKARAVINSPGDANCFPAGARIRLADGRVRSMGELQAGDVVVVDDVGATSAVFAFTHRQVTGLYPFTRIHAGSTVLTLSDAHYVYANGKHVRADMVRPGDALLSADGTFKIVQFTRRVLDVGLIAPHTLQGDIVVENVVVSTYTGLFPRDVAHALLAPVRMVVRSGISAEPLNSIFYTGLPRLPRFNMQSLKLEFRMLTV